MDILPEWQVPGRPTRDRSVVIVEEGVQLTQPVTFTGALEGAWYVDLVTVVDRGAECEIHDCFVDLLVFPDERRYEVLDLDELGDALASGSIDGASAVSVLRNAQRFVERRLGGTRSDSPAVWPPFPPASAVPLLELPDPLRPRHRGPDRGSR
ncbi:DUF402 domain-containing protein [Occultella kanbiaonis]|uniref:DUF402 domain-containing protein n=1 Tax=Occultella kanbiaonis TaxID=2675754 RepID=UPI0012B6E257|nr:DUF402 domain-containing protein [Occultella kanbiaonis]